MVRRIIVLACGLLGGSLVSWAQSELPADSELPTVAEVYRGYVEANGGRANIQAIQTVIVKGRVIPGAAGEGEPYDFTVYRKRPNLMRVVSENPRATYETVWDGRRGIRRVVSPDGASEAVKLSGDDLEQLVGDSEMDGPFFQLEGRADYLEVEAFEEILGHSCVRLKVLPAADFEFSYIWLSREHYQEVKLRIAAEESADDDESIVFDQFEQLHGVWFAHRAKYYEGDSHLRTVQIEKVRANVGIFDSFFSID